MKRKGFLIFIICFSCIQIMAQEAAETVERTSVKNKQESKINSIKGTFQLIHKKEIEHFEYVYLLPIIEKRRDKNEVIIVKLTNNTLLKIMPESIINSEGFIPINEEYYFEK